MRYYLWLAVFWCLVAFGMEQKQDAPVVVDMQKIGEVVHIEEIEPEIEYECDGSWEQYCGYYLSCAAVVAGSSYTFSRVTPYRHPINPGLLGSNEWLPEKEQFLLLAPMCCMFACASSTKPDHSCCVGRCQLCGRRIKQFVKWVFPARLRKKKYSDLEFAALDDAPGAPVVSFMDSVVKKKNN